MNKREEALLNHVHDLDLRMAQATVDKYRLLYAVKVAAGLVPDDENTDKDPKVWLVEFLRGYGFIPKS
jgi:hypothetical protein